MRTNRLILLLLLFLFTLNAQVLAAPIPVVLNNQPITFSVEPVVENERVLVQMRPIFEALGASLEWDGPTQTVAASRDATVIKLTIGNATAYVDGAPTTLDVPARAIEGCTMVPLRFISEALGASVDYKDGVVTIIPGPEEEGPPISTETPGHIDSVKVHVIDVGQADSIYIQLPDNNDILIDGGNKADGATVVNYLKAQNVDDIELMIATHPHEDHIGGLPAVLSAYDVDEVFDSGETATSKIYGEFESAVASESCKHESDNLQKFAWGTVELDILSSTSDWSDVNDQSVICKLIYGQTSFLFTGDAEADALLALGPVISADAFKIGHHGSDNAATPDLLAMVKPSIAIISVGAGNTYGHPTQETLGNLSTAGVTLYRTDLAGSIVIQTDGNTLAVQ